MSRLVFWVIAVVLFAFTFAYQGLFDYEADDRERVTETSRNADSGLADMAGPARLLQRLRGKGPNP